MGGLLCLLSFLYLYNKFLITLVRRSFYPGDLLPFTRRPMMLIVESGASQAFSVMVLYALFT